MEILANFKWSVIFKVNKNTIFISRLASWKLGHVWFETQMEGSEKKTKQV